MKNPSLQLQGNFKSIIDRSSSLCYIIILRGNWMEPLGKEESNVGGRGVGGDRFHPFLAQWRSPCPEECFPCNFKKQIICTRDADSRISNNRGHLELRLFRLQRICLSVSVSASVSVCLSFSRCINFSGYLNQPINYYVHIFTHIPIYLLAFYIFILGCRPSEL